MNIYPSIDYRYSYLYYDWYLFIFFYYYKYHRHHYGIYYYHFLFYPNRTFFFPRVTIFFLGGFLSKTPCIESNCSFSTRWKEVSVFVEFSLFYRVGMSICKEQIGDKFSLSLPIQKSLQVASGMLWRTSNIVNRNVFMNSSISIL